jgi:translation initiation factor RLI1
MTAFIESMQGMLQDAENRGEKDKLVKLSWTPQQGNSVKGVTVKDLLLQLMQEKWLHSKKKLYDMEPSSLDPKN